MKMIEHYFWLIYFGNEGLPLPQYRPEMHNTSCFPKMHLIENSILPFVVIETSGRPHSIERASTLLIAKRYWMAANPTPTISPNISNKNFEIAISLDVSKRSRKHVFDDGKSPPSPYIPQGIS